MFRQRDAAAALLPRCPALFVRPRVRIVSSSSLPFSSPDTALPRHHRALSLCCHRPPPPSAPAAAPATSSQTPPKHCLTLPATPSPLRAAQPLSAHRSYFPAPSSSLRLSSFFIPPTHRTFATMAEPVSHSRPAGVERLADRLDKPLLDTRSYRVVKLPNQLEALLIHDADTDKASAAMDVNVGSFSDVKELPGIAHAVEHLLFMGTEKVSDSQRHLGLILTST